MVRGAIGRARGGYPEPVLADHRKHRSILQPTERIDDRTIDQRQSERGHEAVQVDGRAGIVMRPIDRCGQAECRVGAGGEQAVARHRKRAAQLIEILLVGQRRRFVEPFRRQHLGRYAVTLAAVGQLDARAHEQLRRFAQGDDAEAKRQPQRHRPLEEFRCQQSQLRRAHGVTACIRPRM